MNFVQGLTLMAVGVLVQYLHTERSRYTVTVGWLHKIPLGMNTTKIYRVTIVIIAQ